MVDVHSDGVRGVFCECPDGLIDAASLVGSFQCKKEIRGFFVVFAKRSAGCWSSLGELAQVRLLAETSEMKKHRQ